LKDIVPSSGITNLKGQTGWLTDLTGESRRCHDGELLIQVNETDIQYIMHKNSTQMRATGGRERQLGLAIL